MPCARHPRPSSVSTSRRPSPPRHVDVRVATHLGREGIWVTADDVALARRVSEVAQRHRLIAVPGEVTQVEMGLDTAHRDRLGPFWAAVLTGSTEGWSTTRVLDPTGPAAVDVVPGDRASTTCPVSGGTRTCGSRRRSPRRRIAAAVAAGGTVVDDSEAPSFTVLADPDGNKVCVCTFLDRG